jgi:hypothetical protein
MPQTRAERRRQARGGSAPPPHRDPMRPVYVAAGVIVAAVAIAFLLFNWQQKRLLERTLATPTPLASATSQPIQLSDGEKLGAPYFKAKFPDTAQGGHGQTIDGITCLGGEGLALHIHSHLALFDRGKQIQVPQWVGFAENPRIPGGGCLYWIHTHAPDGIIHVEAPQIAPQGHSGYTLGMFFDIWGQPLTNDDVARIKGPVTAYVNGMKYDGNLRQIPLVSHQQIVLEVGAPVVPPPNYAFPPND